MFNGQGHDGMMHRRESLSMWKSEVSLGYGNKSGTIEQCCVCVQRAWCSCKSTLDPLPPTRKTNVPRPPCKAETRGSLLEFLVTQHLGHCSGLLSQSKDQISKGGMKFKIAPEIVGEEKQ